MPTNAYGIFQGGGAKGFAYVGAIKEAELRGIEFVGVAGTSAGAIVAALLASGYTADELYNPNLPAGQRGLLDLDLSQYFGNWRLIWALREVRKGAKFLVSKLRELWKRFNLVQKFVLYPFCFTGLGFCWVAVACLLILIFAICALWNVFRYGIVDTDDFALWLNDKIITGLKKKNPNFKTKTASEMVQFKDMNLNLKIIASHVSEKRMHSFPDDGYDDVTVVEAVCASISIPFVFMPKRIEGFYFVDGGIVSNFPAWIFESEQIKLKDKLDVLGFTLQEAQVAANAHRRLWPLEYLFSIGATVLQGQWALSTRSVEKLRMIKISTSAELLDFDMDDFSKATTYKEGSDAARILFETH